MNQIASSPSIKDDALRLMDHPAKFFNYSINEMHAIPRARIDELQATALALRFEEQVQKIPMVQKLATNQGITRIDAPEAIVPLLFEHTMYKSYPVSFLGNRQFDKLTAWLNKLTSVEIGHVDVTHCDSIDSWLEHLAAVTELDPITTSGSTGTMSFVPKRKRDIEVGFRSNRVSELQTFGKQPTETQKHGDYHVIWPIYADGRLLSFRGGQYSKLVYANGKEDYFHPLYPQKGSADLMWLAAQMRAAAAKGDASRINVPPSLLARREELEKQQASMPARQMAFVEEVTESLRDKLVYCMYPSYPLYQVAERGLAAGRKCSFAPGSIIGTAGGAKGMPLPANWLDIVRDFFAVEIPRYYGMSEWSALCKMCPNGNYHFQPWVLPFILDPDTSVLQPRTGKQKGRAAFFDVMVSGQWGGIITGDEIEVEFSELCGCGQTTQYMSPEIARFGEKRGGDDKISCAAAPQAHADALDFLTSFR
jgi:hypothetical protein